MTASSVDFFPYRVQLLGLPKSTSIAAAKNTTRPPIAKLQRVSRNLFGVPDQDEMKIFYQQEAERTRSYVLERYSFNTSILQHTSERELKQPTDNIHTTPATTIHAMQPTQFPTLIEQEICKHEQRLQDETHSLNRPPSESTPTNEEVVNHGRSPIIVARRNCNSSSSMSPAVERFKPYSRQSLLKERFNIRKNKVCMTKKDQHCKNKIINLENSRRNLEIFQYSQTVNSQQRNSDINFIKEKELPNSDEVKNKQLDDEDRSRTLSYNQNCTTLSLQVVVSTQNAS